MRRDLAERGHDLARMLRLLLPDDSDVAGLLALVLLTDARSGARLDEHPGQEVGPGGSKIATSTLASGSKRQLSTERPASTASKPRRSVETSL